MILVFNYQQRRIWIKVDFRKITYKGTSYLLSTRIYLKDFMSTFKYFYYMKAVGKAIGPKEKTYELPEGEEIVKIFIW